MEQEQKDLTTRLTQLIGILEPLTSEDRKKIISGTMGFLGETFSVASGGKAGQKVPPGGGANESETLESAQGYFDHKNPTTKQESLAVAARFFEQTTGGSTLTKEDFQGIFSNARRNFDRHNFARNMDNAKASDLFTRSTGKNQFILSHLGQKYVDSLPDRETVKLPKKSKKPGRKVQKNNSEEEQA